MPSDATGVLEQVSFGSPTAEEEAAQLERYFVETPQWRAVRNGEADVIYGPKGSGKSAIYWLLMKRSATLADEHIRLVPAENPRGTTVFEQLSLDPPTSETEFRALWKLYLLTILGDTLRSLEGNTNAADVVRTLEEGKLLEPESNLSSKLRAAYDYARNLLRLESVEGGIKIDPMTGQPTGITGKITIREPSYENRKLGLVSVDSLLSQADAALQSSGSVVWFLLDRLDNAFYEHPDLESAALRALFRVYLDFARFSNLKLKIFLRTDIWRRITEEGFPEASHINRKATLEWNADSLLHVLTGRIVDNQVLLSRYGVDKQTVLADAAQQKAFFYRIFPDKVDAGSNRPRTFEWMLNHIVDGKGTLAPRELIQLVTGAREEQLKLLKLAMAVPTGELLFAPDAIGNAMPSVSQARYERTLCAEYPKLKPYMDKLEAGKTEQSINSLSKAWGTSREETEQVTKALTDVGFFERNVSKKTEEVTYWIPLLYREALKLVQGRATE